jgi:hypothetical protein
VLGLRSHGGVRLLSTTKLAFDLGRGYVVAHHRPKSFGPCAAIISMRSNTMARCSRRWSRSHASKKTRSRSPQLLAYVGEARHAPGGAVILDLGDDDLGFQSHDVFHSTKRTNAQTGIADIRQARGEIVTCGATSLPFSQRRGMQVDAASRAEAERGPAARSWRRAADRPYELLIAWFPSIRARLPS